MTAVSQAIVVVSSALTTLGTAANRIEIQQDFTGELVDVLKVGLGALVDTDLAEDTALIEALQIKQQLGVQALSIANGAPKAILGLFFNQD